MEGVPSKKKLKTFHIPPNLEWEQSPQYGETCGDKIVNPCDDLNAQNLNVQKRIGSESLEAMVFKIGIGNCTYAAKTLLNINDNSNAKNQNEIAIAQLASSKGQPRKHFLKIFGAQKCGNIQMHSFKESNLVQAAKKHHLGMYLQKKWGTKGKFFRKKHRNLTWLEFEKLAKKTFPNVGIDPKQVGIDPKQVGTVEGYVLFSELLWGDVAQLLKQSENQIANTFIMHEIVWQVLIILKGLWEMQILHNDLHIGNLLLRVRDNTAFDVVVHDFGKSRVVEKWDIDVIKQDILFFLEGIAKHMYVKNNAQLAKQLLDFQRFIDNIQDFQNIEQFHQLLTMKWDQIAYASKYLKYKHKYLLNK